MYFILGDSRVLSRLHDPIICARTESELVAVSNIFTQRIFGLVQQKKLFYQFLLVRSQYLYLTIIISMTNVLPLKEK